jgi:hypothetical protein
MARATSISRPLAICFILANAVQGFDRKADMSPVLWSEYIRVKKPAQADRQREQLRSVLQALGATPSMPVTILSDGAAGPRSLGEAASLGPT